MTAGERVSLAQLRERAAGCRDRELWRGATQTVFGEGPATARLMLVGEQPGDREDREGRPFVCLGLTAGHALLGSKLSIGRDRGRLLETELAPAALLTAHPSSVLRERDSDARHAAHAALVRDLRIASAAC